MQLVAELNTLLATLSSSMYNSHNEMLQKISSAEVFIFTKSQCVTLQRLKSEQTIIMKSLYFVMMKKIRYLRCSLGCELLLTFLKQDSDWGRLE